MNAFIIYTDSNSFEKDPRGIELPLTSPQFNPFKKRKETSGLMMHYFDEPILMKDFLGMISGPEGIGKSLFVSQLASALATGMDFGCIQTTKKHNVLLILPDESNRELHSRTGIFSENHEGYYTKIYRRNPNYRDFLNWLNLFFEVFKDKIDLDVVVLNHVLNFSDMKSADDYETMIHMMKTIALEYNVMILFADGIPLSNQQPILEDACSWVGYFDKMQEDTMKKLGVGSGENVFEFNIKGKNSMPLFQEPLLYHYDMGGFFSPVVCKQIMPLYPFDELIEVI